MENKGRKKLDRLSSAIVRVHYMYWHVCIIDAAVFFYKDKVKSTLRYLLFVQDTLVPSIKQKISIRMAIKIIKYLNKFF